MRLKREDRIKHGVILPTCYTLLTELFCIIQEIVFVFAPLLFARKYHFSIEMYLGSND